MTPEAPQTDAGKALLDELVPEATGHELTCDECRALNHEERDHVGGDIAAIEAEARSQLLASTEFIEALADILDRKGNPPNHAYDLAYARYIAEELSALLEPPR